MCRRFWSARALNFFSLPIGDNSILIGMFLMAGGGFSIIISLNILRYAYRRRFVSYAVEETGQGLGQVSDRALDGIGRVIGKGSEAVANGINKAGGLRINAGQDIKEIVVVKCRNCGEKNDEDANFCDNCGQPL